MNTKNNQRFKASESAMKTAMLTLMQEKAVHEISVGELCQRADVNRSTFYAHYNDIHGLLESVADDLSEELLSEVSEIKSGKPYTEYLLLYFAHIKKHRSFYKPAMLCRNPLSMDKAFEAIVEKIVVSRCKSAGIADEREIMYHSAFLKAGMMSIFRRWLEKDCTESEEEMLDIMSAHLIKQ